MTPPTPAGGGDDRGSAIGSVTVAIPSWNGRRHLRECLQGLREQIDPGVRWQTAVLDNASTDGTAAWLARRHPDVRLLTAERNVGFAAACNRLVESSDTDAVAFLNNDARPRRRWLGALVAALADASSDVVAVGGKVVDWTGDRLDFAGGILTFDGHAFQRNHGRAVEGLDLPAAGSELLFATGSNMIVRRREFSRLGGFDPDYFAYLEDVDFGWRAWSAGGRVLFAPDAVVHHRGAASSDRLGNARRGFLIERNAFATAYKNYDAAILDRVLPAILMTLISRVTGCLAEDPATGKWLGGDPVSSSSSPPSYSRPGLILTRLLSPLSQRGRLRPGAQAEAQLRALRVIVRDLGGLDARRRVVQADRVREDREIFARFPLYVVPTYPGDADLFDDDAFRRWLPDDLPLVYRELAEIVSTG